MDELEISGKRYISAKRIAKENKYHPDYVGQLIRAGRISGTKVGRAWYVDEASFAEYLGKERGTFLASAQEPASPQRGEFSAENSPTYGAVAPAYISAETVPAATSATAITAPDLQEETTASFAIVEPAYIPKEVTPVAVSAIESNSAAEGTPQHDGARTEQIPSREFAYPEAVTIAVEAPQKKVAFKTSLTYIPDNSPLFPAIQKRTKPLETKREEYVVAQIAKPTVAISRPKKSGLKTGFAFVSIVLVAGIFFSFAFFGSLGINSVVMVEKGKPASVAFAQEKTFCFIFGNCQSGKK